MYLKGSELSESIRDAIKSVIDTYEYNYQRIGELDDLKSDLEHEVEWSNYNVVEGYKAYKELQNMFRERRERKNENDSLKPLYDLFESKKKLIDQLNQKVGECRKNDEALSRRKYHPRVKTEIKDKVNEVMRNVISL